MICLLFVGLSIALVEIKEKRVEEERATRVSTPMFGGLNQRHAEGPWPECLDFNGEACVDLLKLWTEDLDIELVGPGVAVEKGFRTDRVHIFVDDNNVVAAIPQRG